MKRLLTAILRMMLPALQDALAPILDDLIQKAGPKIKEAVRDLIDEEVNNLDLESTVEQALNDAGIDREIERAIEDARIDKQIEEIIEGYEIDEAIEAQCQTAVEEFEVREEFEKKIKAMVRKEYRALLLESAEHATLSE